MGAIERFISISRWPDVELRTPGQFRTVCSLGVDIVPSIGVRCLVMMFQFLQLPPEVV